MEVSYLLCAKSPSIASCSKSLCRALSLYSAQANKPEAERVRDMGAEALRSGQLSRAIKLLTKSLQLYPLPGVEALLAQAQRQQQQQQQQQSESAAGNDDNNTSTRRASSSTTANGTSTASTTTTNNNTNNGRSYTPEQVNVVQKVLKNKEGGRGAHYRVLEIPQNASEADIKKAYRKLALKLHPVSFPLRKEQEWY